MPDFESLSAEYRSMWDSATVRPEREGQARRAAAKVMAGRNHYEAVQGATGVPWYWVGLAHMRESYCNFGTHLHNGDPLSRRTYHVPAGRPATGQPPFSWDDSAQDALRMHGLDKIADWPIERVLFELERYNGWGYRKIGRGPSPYIWADTDKYHAGKYVADGVYSGSAVDPQDGCVAVLKCMLQTDPNILGGDPVSAEATSAPKAIDGMEAADEPTQSEQHQQAHADLKQQSASYSWLDYLRKKLGLPVAASAGGASLLDDPLSTAQTALGFLKTYGIELVGGAVVILLFLEGFQAVRRQREINK